LDEIAELDPLVQAKLLRVLETREVLPLGASSPKRVEISVCAASHRDLREEVGAQRFREDLYYRIGRPEVRIPPLRERLDELPRYIARELANVDPRLSPSIGLVEACARREWPGNVRELLKEIRHAGHAALAREVTQVDARDLAEGAGTALRPNARPAEAPARAAPPDDESIARALAENGGNVRGTARALGMHRNQLRRWIEKRGGTVSGPEDD
jgi:transcriptional regulator with PAS, ATPase and Fis domain